MIPSPRPILRGLAGLIAAALAFTTTIRGEERKPNFLLILADDLGWSDLGCYGGEIATPNLDGLANGGLRFRQFYNSARCSPTRASILTGLHPHQAGFPNLSGTLPPNAVTIPEVLKTAGYRTYMVGKWHLNNRVPPTERGFDEFFGMLGGYNSCWQEEPFYTRWPQDRTRRPYAPDKFYSTEVFGDYAIDFVGKGISQPWFLYLAFNAPHFPLHAPEKDIQKYESMYFDKGWDRIRQDRLTRQKRLGLVPDNLLLTPRAIVPANKFNGQTGWADKENPAWETLPEDRRRDLAHRMAVFAAMVDCMDQAVGRVVAHLKTTGQFDNTVIFFLSDNGACAEWDPYGFDENSGPQNILHRGEDLKNAGASGSYISYGSAWAHACNTPWRLFKHYNHEGGIRTPLIVHWPAGLKAKGLAQGPGYITDFMPTICELAGASYPQTRGGLKVMPQEGVSMVPAIRGEAVQGRPIFIEHEGNRSVRDGDWKLVALAGRPWELYDLASDETEMHDLAAQDPQRVKTMAARWEGWALRAKVKTDADKPEDRKKSASSGGGKDTKSTVEKTTTSSKAAQKPPLAPTSSPKAGDRPVLFRDDFDSALTSRYTLFGGEWIAEDGVLTVKGDKGPKAMIKDLSMADFEMTLEIQVATKGTQAGVIFRASNPVVGIDGFRGYFVGMQAGANQALWGANDPTWRSIARQPAEIRPGQWYRLRLLVSGNNVKAFLNEVPVAAGRYPKFDGIDARFTKGQIGLRAVGGTARFRNLIVRSYDPVPSAATYTNPVQPGCADPVILLHEGIYYAYSTCSTDHPDMPKGIRLCTSPDLVHWQDRGYVLKNEDSWGDSKFWAPDIIEKDGIFYLYYAADTRICVATAKTPLGPFKQEVQCPIEPDTIRIDGHVFKDDDGQCYFYYVSFNKGNEIWGGKLNPDMVSVDRSTLRLMVKPDQPWEQQQARVTEGPTILKHNGTYYLTYSGSHFESPEYAVGYASSGSPLGPWKKYEYNPIMKSTTYAHGTAHHCFTKSPDGREDFIVYHRHHTLTETEPRQMAIDRVQFVSQDNGPAILEVWGPTSSPQPMPAGAPEP